MCQKISDLFAFFTILTLGPAGAEPEPARRAGETLSSLSAPRFRRQAGRQADRQAVRQADRQADRQAGRQSQAGRQAATLSSWPVKAKKLGSTYPPPRGQRALYCKSTFRSRLTTPG